MNLAPEKTDRIVVALNNIADRIHDVEIILALISIGSMILCFTLGWIITCKPKT